MERKQNNEEKVKKESFLPVAHIFLNTYSNNVCSPRTHGRKKDRCQCGCQCIWVGTHEQRRWQVVVAIVLVSKKGSSPNRTTAFTCATENGMRAPKGANLKCLLVLVLVLLFSEVPSFGGHELFWRIDRRASGFEETLKSIKAFPLSLSLCRETKKKEKTQKNVDVSPFFLFPTRSLE